MAKKSQSREHRKESSSRRSPPTKQKPPSSKTRRTSQPRTQRRRSHHEEGQEAVEKPQSGVAVTGDVTNSTLVGRDFIQEIYSSLPVPESVKANARPITVAFSAVCELFALIATRADIRRWQLERFPPMLTPHAIQQNMPLPSFVEILGMFLKNSVLFFGLGVLVAIGIIAALGYMQRAK